MPKQSIGYVRVSTEQQGINGVSIDAQQAKLAAWSMVNDCELAGMYVESVSGKRADNRPELQKALKHVSECGGVLVVYSLSRLARSTKDTIEIAEQLDKAGADLVSLSEKIDTTTAAGKMVFRMLAVLNEFERDQVAERTKSAMQYKRQRGELVGNVPFGFDLDGDGITLVSNVGEQHVLDLIDELRERGESLRKIADELTRRGIQTKEGKQRWQHSTIQRILSRHAA